MQNRMYVAGALLSVCVMAAAWANPECCAPAANAGSAIDQANAQIVALKAIAPDWATKLSAEDKTALESAQAALGKSCPICKAMPEAMAWIGASLQAVNFTAPVAEAKDAAANPLAQRAELSAKSLELFGALCAVMHANGPKAAGKDACCGPNDAAAAAAPAPEAGKAAPAVAEAGDAKAAPTAAANAGDAAPATAAPATPDLKSLLARADEVAAHFGEARKTFLALQGAEKDAVIGGLATLRAKNPAFAAFPQSLRSLGALVDATVAFDQACEKMCSEKGAEAQKNCPLGGERAALVARIAALLKDIALVTASDEAKPAQVQ